MTDDLKAMLETAKDAAGMGGEILRERFGNLKDGEIDLKGKGDYVTELDRLSESAIKRRIRDAFSNHIIQAEESGIDHRDSQYRWLVDPLDGTANYVQGIPLYAVSVAVMKGTSILAGVVYDQERDEMFSAVRGGGAFLNGCPVRVSQKADFSYAMLASGFPFRSKAFFDPYMECFKHLFLEAAGIRRMGVAAIDLAYTACGRFDGFWEMKLSPWDIAAGILLIEEAGGIVTDFQGEKGYFSSGNVAAGNPEIHAKVQDETREHLSKIP